MMRTKLKVLGLLKIAYPSVLFLSSVLLISFIPKMGFASEDSIASVPENASRGPAAVRDSEDGDEEDEYNFSWLDPDKQVYVLQNRKYKKARKLELFLSGGLNLSNPFKTEFLGQPRLAYWFAEQFGIEAFYAFVGNSDNDTFKALRTVSTSALPFARENLSYVGGVFSWIPWYAKLNFFNKILYFDWALNGGIGQVSTKVDLNNSLAGDRNFKEESFTAFFLGTSQNYYLTRNWTVRLDLIGMFYSAKGADNATTKMYKNFDFTAGVGYLF